MNNLNYFLNDAQACDNFLYNPLASMKKRLDSKTSFLKYDDGKNRFNVCICRI